MKRNAKNRVDKKSDHRTICDSGFIFGFTVFCSFTESYDRTEIPAGYFNGELVGNIAGHVSVDDAVHEVRRELAAESDEPLCMDYEYSSSKANDCLLL